MKINQNLIDKFINLDTEMDTSENEKIKENLLKYTYITERINIRKRISMIFLQFFI